MYLGGLSYMQILAMLTVFIFGHVLGVLCYKLAAVCCLQLWCQCTCICVTPLPFLAWICRLGEDASWVSLGTEQPVQQPAFSPNLPVWDRSDAEAASIGWSAAFDPLHAWNESVIFFQPTRCDLSGIAWSDPDSYLFEVVLVWVGQCWTVSQPSAQWHSFNMDRTSVLLPFCNIQSRGLLFRDFGVVFPPLRARNLQQLSAFCRPNWPFNLFSIRL